MPSAFPRGGRRPRRLVDRRAVRLGRSASPSVPSPAVGWVGTDAGAITFFVGSIFFTSAASLQFLQTLDAPHAVRSARASGDRRPLLDLEDLPHRLVGQCAVQLVGTVFFNVTTFAAIDASLDDPGASPRVDAGHDRLDLLPRRQRPGLVRGEPRLMVVAPRSISWRIAALNLAGSIAFGVSAVASKVVTTSGEPRNITLVDLGTAVGVSASSPARCSCSPSARSSPSTDGALNPEVSPSHCTRMAESTPISSTRSTHNSAEASHAPRRARRCTSSTPTGVPARSRRAHARRQLAAEPRHLRHHLDRAAGAAAHGRDLDKNMIDKDEYPHTAEIEPRCVTLAGCGTRRRRGATGTSTTGSSEAAMLGGMALKWRWRDGRKPPASPPTSPTWSWAPRPDLLGEVLPLLGRRGPPGTDGRRPLPPQRRGGGQALRREHHRRRAGAGVDVRRQLRAGRRHLRRARQAPGRAGLDIPVHVDAAWGGFIAPFLDPDLVWDFRLPRVQSINTSGHKYGLVYPGVGWVIWRNPTRCPTTSSST